MTARELVRSDPGLPALGVVLDPDRLAEAVGGPVRPTRIRYKRGVDVVLAFDGPDGPSFIAGYADPAKTAKTIDRAARNGVLVRRVHGTAGMITGPATGDRALVEGLSRCGILLSSGSRILRYNPHRRLVIRSGDRVLRIVAERGETASAAAEELQRSLSLAGLPVVAPVAVDRGVSWTSWWGDGDLAVEPDLAAARRAGAAVARLHALDPATLGPRRPMDIALRSELSVAAGAVGDLVPASAERASRIARKASGGDRSTTVLVHGDLSADQILRGGDEIRLIDFDRIRLDEPERDLGGFLASDEARLGPAFLNGYRDEGGVIDEETLRRRHAGALLLRAVEPFRSQQPGWHDLIDDALDRAERILG